MNDSNENPNGEMVIYQTGEGKTRIDVRFLDENVWLTQTQLVVLFQSSKANISEHIKHIFEESELEEDSVVRNFRTTAADGKNYQVAHYNLDRILSTTGGPLLEDAGRWLFQCGFIFITGR